ncbi:MAG: EamA family transporter, partial [Acidobacteria bacterium]|nr:EamA family transporter [Acidobacteriota bacterium]
MTDAERLRFTQFAAFAAVYLIWGSTYLAIRIAIETLPGLLMSGVRFLLGGLVLYAIARSRGAERPRVVHWRSAAVIGLFLFVGGNGGVVIAEHWVPSGLAALFVGVEPLWIVLALALWPGGAERPSRHTV